MAGWIIQQIVFREVWACGQLQAVSRDVSSGKKHIQAVLNSLYVSFTSSLSSLPSSLQLSDNRII